MLCQFSMDSHICLYQVHPNLFKPFFHHFVVFLFYDLLARTSLQPILPIHCMQWYPFSFFLSRDILSILPCLLPAHSSQSLSPVILSHSLSSFTPRLLSNFLALSPIHLPLGVPASLHHNIDHSLALPPHSYSRAFCGFHHIPPSLIYPQWRKSKHGQTVRDVKLC